MKSKYDNKALYLLFILSAITGFSCTENKRTNSLQEQAEILPDNIVEMRSDQIRLAEIDTGSIEMRSLSATLKVSGKVSVAPDGYATVSAPLGGFVKSTSLLPGNAVRKGQILAMIENQDFVDVQENYLEAKSRLEYAEAEFKRHSDLYKEDVYSEKNLQQVTADYKSLRSHVSALEQKLAIIGINPKELNEDNIIRSVPIISPIDGFIKSVNVNIGKSISPADILFEIINTNDLFLELTVFEKDVSLVSAGQSIKFYINNEAEEHGAIITQTGKAVDTDKGYRVYAEITKGCKNILPGMFVNAIIETQGQKVPSVPTDAVVTFDDKNYIFAFERNKEEKGYQFTEYKIIEVRKGISSNGYTEIIPPEDFDVLNTKVVIKGAYNLLSAKKNAGEMAC